MTKSLLPLLLMFALPQVQAGATQVFGGAMPPGEAQPIAAAIAASPPDAGPRKFSGRITEVCQAKGCWVMLEDEGYVARVMMKDHSVVVRRCNLPSSCSRVSGCAGSSRMHSTGQTSTHCGSS